jgi:hypothetical protein
VEVKRRLTPATHGAAIMQLQQVARETGHPTLLVTEYLTPPMASKLREHKQQFADAAGNAYLRAPGLLVQVTGRKPQVDHALPNAGKAHTMTGLKVTFALLCDPEWPMRHIAPLRPRQAWPWAPSRPCWPTCGRPGICWYWPSAGG